MGTEPLCWIPVDPMSRYWVQDRLPRTAPKLVHCSCLLKQGLISSDGRLFLSMEGDRRGRSILLRQNPFDSDNFPFWVGWFVYFPELFY